MVRPSNFHSQVVDRIGRMIVSGRFALEGVVPNEYDLATELSVSRTVIREASKTLQALGLITTGPRVGARVQPLRAWRLLDPQVMEWIADADMASAFTRDLLELRGMIEPAAAAYAAERGTVDQLDAIRAAFQAMTEAQEKSAHELADFAFHEAVLEASGNLLLIQLRPILHAVLKASFRLSMHDHDRAQASLVIHRRVATAISARQPEKARKAMVALLHVAQVDISLGADGAPPDEEEVKNSKETEHDRKSGKVGSTRA